MENAGRKPNFFKVKKTQFTKAYRYIVIERNKFVKLRAKIETF